MSAKTTPLIEESLQQVIDAHDTITDLDFFQTLFHQPVNSPFKMFDNTSEVKDFHDQVEQLISSEKITGLQIYIDLPGTSMWLFQNELTNAFRSCMEKTMVLKYSSTPGQGTEVEIRIPARRQSPVIDNTYSKKTPCQYDRVSFFEYVYGYRWLVTIQ